jgi:hypothetical protein
VKAYVVGGAVRDELLGLPLKDRDYVVVGATPEEMVRRGFKPVGKDFPVFLHPQTKEEYALARTERKSGRGYKGFTVHAAPDVTLEDDLRRRDLTINAMARDLDSGALIDPFHGREDLEKKILRHVSEAFAEDPVRILRVARFAARFGFRVADETMAHEEIGRSGLPGAERVWQEFARGLAEPHPRACSRCSKVASTNGVKPVLLLLAKANASIAVLRGHRLAASGGRVEPYALDAERSARAAPRLPQPRCAPHLRPPRRRCSSSSSAPTRCAGRSASASFWKSLGSPTRT